MPEQVVAPDHVGIVILSLRFYELIESEMYALETQKGVRILDCLV